MAGTSVGVKGRIGARSGRRAWIAGAALAGIAAALVFVEPAPAHALDRAPAATSATTADAVQAAAKRKRSQVPVARRLAKRVTKAKSDRARRKALLAVMKRLNLGVYKGSGKAMVPGADRSVKDPYLYRFELDMLVGALERRDQWSLEDLAAEMEAAGLRPEDGSVSQEDLAKALRKVTRKAVKKRGSKRSLAMLVVRELGKRHRPRYDLARLKAADDPRFDPLQRTLILADLALAARKEARREQSGKTATASAASTACGNFKKAFRFPAGILDAFGADVPFAGDVVSVWHAWVVSTGVEVKPVGGAVDYVHYGPGNHDEEVAQSKIAGDPLDFTLQVTMLEKRSDREIECGALAGVTVPKEGPIPDVEIDWSATIGGHYEELLKHGKVIREDEKTGGDGRASFILKPNDEVLVGIGEVEHEQGSLQPDALVLTTLGNGRAVLENIGVAKFTTFIWDVSFHPQKASLLFDSVLTLPPEGLNLSCFGFDPDMACSTDGQIVARYISVVPVELDPATVKVRGRAELAGVRASGEVSHTYRCIEGEADTLTSRFTALGGSSPGVLDVSEVSGGVFTSGPRLDLLLAADGGRTSNWQSYPTETYRFTRTGTAKCPIQESDTRNVGAWYGNFNGAHQDELDSSENALRLTGFTPSGDGFVKRYQRTVPINHGAGYTYDVVENTTIELHPRG